MNLQQGRRATIAFFRNYVNENRDSLKRKQNLSVIEEEPKQGSSVFQNGMASSTSVDIEQLDQKHDEELKRKIEELERAGEMEKYVHVI